MIGNLACDCFYFFGLIGRLAVPLERSDRALARNEPPGGVGKAGRRRRRTPARGSNGEEEMMNRRLEI